ncbi:Methylated-DNA--protein-cysteine methyltransferase [hydrothermal vent metagenome]|uniref:methylated-DNA--[protein]-cysteine S-methyltransferase n=1 Tax=hydrothermal vent metagenome TaxID=652676 RepID=A0A3B0ZJ67_9ZZZZ
MIDDFVMSSPVGYLYLQTSGDTVVGLEYNTRKRPGKKLLSKQQAKIKKHIMDYFAIGKSKEKSKEKFKMDLNLELTGTTFQKRVWAVLQKIPAGKVKTYGEVAKQLNSSARAVGNACRANPIPLIVPCHRVIAKTGIGGFSGKTNGASIDRKRWLLAHEGVSL